MRSVPENLYIDEKGTGVREFRVSSVTRYQVTDWESFNGAEGKSGVRTIAENLTLAQANAIAEAYGLAYPGSLVNGMEALPIMDNEDNARAHKLRAKHYSLVPAADSVPV